MHPDHHVLTQLCAELPALRRALRGSPGRLTLLEQAVEAARSGTALVPLMRELGIAVADSDGSDAGARSSFPWSKPWASGSGRPVGGTYVCPQSLCGREQVRGPGEGLPMCHLTARALTFAPTP